MRVLVLTTRLFAQPASGGERCTQRLLEALVAEGHALHWLGRGPVPPPPAGLPGAPAAGPAAWRCDSLGPLEPPFATLPLARRAGALAAALAGGQASTVQRLAAGGVARRLAGLLQGRPAPDAVVVDHLQAWPWLLQAQAVLARPLPRPLLVMHNHESADYAGRAARRRGPARWLLAREARLLAALELQALADCAAVACLGADDARGLQAQAGAAARAPLLLLPGHASPPPAATGAWAAVPGLRARAGAGRRIGVIGSWTWGPNREALAWLIGQVLPLLAADCTLVVAGQGVPPGLAAPPGPTVRARLQVLGAVPDLDAFYAGVDLVALPSLQGSGVLEKAIEALARAPCVVATPHALRGLEAAPLPQVRLAADAEAFAALCSSLPLPGPAARAAARQATAQWAAQRAQAYRLALRAGLQASAASLAAAGGLAGPGQAGAGAQPQAGGQAPLAPVVPGDAARENSRPDARYSGGVAICHIGKEIAAGERQGLHLDRSSPQRRRRPLHRAGAHEHRVTS